MKYSVNPSVFSAVFTMPCEVADKYLKIATPLQLKVLIHIMRNLSNGIEPRSTAEALSQPLSEIEDALFFWQECGVLNGEKLQEAPEKTVVVTVEQPTRADVIKRGLEDENLMFLLREAQLKFGRNLKQNESSLLVSLYDDHGMDVSVVLLLLQYAKSENKCNVTFIKNTAVKWLSAGVQTVADAEALISQLAAQKLAWSVVERTFGIEKRVPSARELELSNLWVNDYKFGTDMLKAAYDRCVDAKTKLSMPYIAKILESWHAAGYKTPQDITDKKTAKATEKKPNYAGYDLDLFEKMLNEDD